MPRVNNGTEIWKALKGVSVIRVRTAGGATTTISAAAAAEAQALTVAAIAGFQNGDPILISSANGLEANEVSGAPTGNTLPLRWKIINALAVGATVYRATQVFLGHVEQSGITVTNSQQTTDIFAADRTVAIGRQPGNLVKTVSGSLLGFNAQNLQFILGASEVEIGTGTAADPFQARIDGSSVGTQGLQVFRIEGVRADGRIVFFDCNEISVGANGQFNLSSSAPAALPFEAQYTSDIIRTW